MRLKTFVSIDYHISHSYYFKCKSSQILLLLWKCKRLFSVTATNSTLLKSNADSKGLFTRTVSVTVKFNIVPMVTVRLTGRMGTEPILTVTIHTM